MLNHTLSTPSIIRSANLAEWSNFVNPNARLYQRMRERLVKVARAEGLTIKQSYKHVGRRLLMQSSRYAHARQMKRARACTRKLKTQLGRIIREVKRQTESSSVKLDKLLQTAHRIYEQQRHDKNKIYSVHEPEVESIAKGKAGKQYGFGNKVSVAVSSRGGWFVGVKSFTGNPDDGHTLAAQMRQVESLIADQVSEVYVDRGYRGHDYDGVVTVHVDKDGILARHSTVEVSTRCEPQESGVGRRFR